MQIVFMLGNFFCTGLFLMFLKWLFWDRAIAEENAGPPIEVADPPELW